MTRRSGDEDELRAGSTKPSNICLRKLWPLSATLLIAAAGCVTAPEQPGTPTPPLRPDSVGQSLPSSAKTDFHSTATPRQQFQVHIDFGRAFESQGSLDAAIHEYQDALSVVESRRRGSFRAADEALAHRRIASALDRLGRFAQAETHYQKALKLSPKDPKIWNNAGYSYYLQGRWSDAERALNTAARLAPEDERIRTNLGLTLAAQGHSQAALPLLSRANGEAIGHANLGYLLASSGDLELARQQYEIALAMRPDLDIARRALAQIDSKQHGTGLAASAPNATVERTRSTVHPIDPVVNQTSTTRAKIPPPKPLRIPPDARAPFTATDRAMIAPAVPSTAIELPPPPPG
jgi:Tfp pilus assembly protein PilF